MIELSKKDMMLPYGGLIIRLIHTYDIVFSRDEEVINLDRFNVINRNILRRLRCIFRNKIQTKLPRRIDPLSPNPEPETPIFRGNQSPHTDTFKETPLAE